MKTLLLAAALWAAFLMPAAAQTYGRPLVHCKSVDGAMSAFSELLESKGSRHAGCVLLPTPMVVDLDWPGLPFVQVTRIQRDYEGDRFAIYEWKGEGYLLIWLDLDGKTVGERFDLEDGA